MRSRRAARLAGGPVGRVWLRILPEVLFWSSLLFRRPIGFPVRIRRHRRTIAFTVWDESELEVVLEVFLDEVYRVDVEEPVRTVLDLGAHTGASVCYFADRYPGTRILAVEPNPVALRRLAHNLRGIRGVEIVAAALDGRSGVAYLAASPGAGTWSARLAGPTEARGSSVETLTLQDLRWRFGLDRIDLVKFDIEGAERHLLDGTDVSGIRALVGEVHLSMGPDLALLPGRIEGLFAIWRRPYGDDELLVATRRS
jgi:FkbM family methyltransferase